MNVDAGALREALRVALAERNAEHGTVFYMVLNEAEALDLASGYVPPTVVSMARTMLDWEEQDRRRAERPMPVARKRARA